MKCSSVRIRNEQSCDHLVSTSDTSSFYQHRSACLHNLTRQVLPPREQGKYLLSKDKKERENVECMLEAIKIGGLLPLVSTNSTLRNTFNGKTAAGDQRRDLLTFQEVGQEYERYVTNTFLQDPSSKLITHQQRLKTFSEKKVTKSTLKSSEQDKIILLYSARFIRGAHSI